MKILFLTDNFPPEVNAPATRTYEHCKKWVEQGVDVTVITCFPNFPKGKVFDGYKNKLYQKETIDGIKVIRVWSFIAANAGTFKRILDYISYAFMAFWFGLFQKTDKIVATSPQFFTAVSGYALSLFKRKPWIMEVRDLWPESIRAVGAINNEKLLNRLEKLELFLYKKAEKVIVVTQSFKENISARGINPNKIHIIYNGIDPNKVNAINVKVDSRLEALKEKFLVGYIGTHGLAHKLDFILNSAKEINDPDIHFILIGDGAEKKKLQELYKELNLTNVTLFDSVSKESIMSYINTLDVALVNLKKSDTFKTVIPSKIFENAALQKPILLGVQGETEGIIKKYKAGVCYVPENKEDFINALTLLKNDEKLYGSCKEGCLNLVKDFDRNILADQMLTLIQSN